MHAKSLVMMKVLFNRYHGGVPDLVVKNLPAEELAQLKEQDITANDPSALFVVSDERLRSIHYSWIAKAVQEFPQGLRPLLLASLPKRNKAGACRVIGCPIPEVEPSPPVRRYLQSVLTQYLGVAEHYPISYLPSTTLSFLVNLSKEQLVQLVTFLGMRDLAEAVRSIVNKNFLQAVFRCLSPQELTYLKYCLHQKEKLAVSRLDLTGWKGDARQLHTMSQRRGLIRLAKALSGHHPDFIWHILRRLDRGRAAVLEKHLSANPWPGVTETLIQQVIGLERFLETEQSKGSTSE